MKIYPSWGCYDRRSLYASLSQKTFTNLPQLSSITCEFKMSCKCLRSFWCGFHPPVFIYFYLLIKTCLLFYAIRFRVPWYITMPSIIPNDRSETCVILCYKEIPKPQSYHTAILWSALLQRCSSFQAYTHNPYSNSNSPVIFLSYSHLNILCWI